jgi:hypothetical protein
VPTVPTLSTVPAAPTVRLALRQVRRSHSDRTIGDLLTDVYLFAFVAVIYGGGASVPIRRHLAQPLTGPAGSANLRAWLVVGLLVVVIAVLWRGLRMIGPLVTTPAAQSWVLATPVDRAGWLRLPYTALLVLVGLLGAFIGLLAGWAGLATAGFGVLWAVLIGAALGLLVAASAVDEQQPGGSPRYRWFGAQISAGRRQRRPVGGRGSAAVIGVGLAIIGAVVVFRRAGWSAASPRVGPTVLWVLLAVGGAAWAVHRGRQALRRLDRAALGGGAQLAGAAVTAAVMLDPSLLSGILTARRWRQAGTVHSRRFRPAERRWVLLQADLVRQLRRRADVFGFVALALAPYAVAVFAPAAAGPIRIVAAYLAVDRLAGGLRAVARSAPLRRILGGTDQELKYIHLVVPAVGLVVWWLATSWAAPAVPSIVEALLLLGILGAVYRTATRPPMAYDVDIADSPLGPVPTTLLRRLVRGPDLVAVLVLLELFTSAGVR